MLCAQIALTRPGVRIPRNPGNPPVRTPLTVDHRSSFRMRRSVHHSWDLPIIKKDAN